MSQNNFVFKGFDWSELAECWGISVEEQPLTALVEGTDEIFELGKVPEKIDKTIFVNGNSVIFTLIDDDEVLAEKIKQYLWLNVDSTHGTFKDTQIRTDIHNFLKALIEGDDGYDTPVWKGLLLIKSDHTLTQWITTNLEKMWT
jgi:hypothetical protein